MENILPVYRVPKSRNNLSRDNAYERKSSTGMDALEFKQILEQAKAKIDQKFSSFENRLNTTIQRVTDLESKLTLSPLKEDTYSNQIKSLSKNYARPNIQRVSIEELNPNAKKQQVVNAYKTYNNGYHMNNITNVNNISRPQIQPNYMQPTPNQYNYVAGLIETPAKKTLWEKMKDGIKNFFGITPKNEEPTRECNPPRQNVTPTKAPQLDMKRIQQKVQDDNRYNQFRQSVPKTKAPQLDLNKILQKARENDITRY